MGKKLYTPVTLAVAALILLVLFFMLRGSLRGPARVVLPEETGSEDVGESGENNDDAIERVDIRPDTVQCVIGETLTRPQQYRRSITIERYYSGGSGLETAEVFCSDGWTRLDVTRSSGEIRHVITDGRNSYLWYGSSKSYYTGGAVLSTDEELGIPTYENILQLDPQRIALADYRLLEGTDCVYVETAPDNAGYIERYWVSVSDGLLVAAEKVQGTDVVYRMAGLEADRETVREDAFTLPDGTVLHEIK